MAIQQLRSYSPEVEKRYFPPVKNRLTESQLQALGEELKKYTKGSTIQIEEWMKSRGALSKNGGVVITNYKPTIYNGANVKQHVDCDPILFEQLHEDLEQYLFWSGRSKYGELKKLEQYEQMAQQANVT